MKYPGFPRADTNFFRESIMKIKNLTLTEDRAIIYKKYGIIADTHIGFDISFNESGANFPLIQKDRVINNILKLIENYKIKSLIINGDLKHNFYPIKREIEFVNEFLNLLNEHVELILIKGNHDTYLSKITETYDYFELGKYTVTHGHKVVEGDFLILAHEHPSIKIRDEITTYKFPIYLVNKNYIVLPAFNPLSPGNDLVNNYPSSPIIKKDYLDGEVFGITEIGLLEFGKLKDLLEFNRL
ncbi:phosphoesterase [Methanocaldococcus villosus KIN24-T80]|uniref:Phosphoesterase n=1 Tax=Methanocaldococcus villosus KIN24-T80 TaxID=1069083 RepID=N6W0E1_9EURY|nr:metallophosphoesterase [Methanocaldococcus villosus]ENN96842.1 phosphoesterase [Methanocaldococcus villosus KIN24-T80]